MPQEYPTLNGVAPSWADQDGTKFNIYNGATIQTADLSAINWSETLELGTVKGVSGGAKRKRTSGEYDCEGSITFYVQGWDILSAALAAQSTRGRVGDAPFDVIQTWTLLPDSSVRLLKLVSCRVVGVSFAPAEGPDPLTVEVSLNIMEVNNNGLRL
jgi:hypothetical protein